MLEDHLAGNDGDLVTLRTLYQTAPTGRQIEDRLRAMQPQRIEVDDIHVCHHPRRDLPAIEHSMGLRRRFEMDVTTCVLYGGRLRVIADITQPEVIAKSLHQLNR